MFVIVDDFKKDKSIETTLFILLSFIALKKLSKLVILEEKYIVILLFPPIFNLSVGKILEPAPLIIKSISCLNSEPSESLI